MQKDLHCNIAFTHFTSVVHGTTLANTPIVHITTKARRRNSVGTTRRVFVDVVSRVVGHDTQSSNMGAQWDLPHEAGEFGAQVLNALGVGDLFNIFQEEKRKVQVMIRRKTQQPLCKGRRLIKSRSRTAMSL